jgi:hypothetical protein
MPNPLTSSSQVKRSARSVASDRPVMANWISFMRSVLCGPISGNKGEARPRHRVLSYDPRDIAWGCRNQGFPRGPITRGCFMALFHAEANSRCVGLVPTAVRSTPPPGANGRGHRHGRGEPNGRRCMTRRGGSDRVKAGLNLCGDHPTAGNARRRAKPTAVSRRSRTAHDRGSGAAPSPGKSRSAINLLGNGGCRTTS